MISTHTLLFAQNSRTTFGLLTNPERRAVSKAGVPSRFLASARDVEASEFPEAEVFDLIPCQPWFLDCPRKRKGGTLKEKRAVKLPALGEVSYLGQKRVIDLSTLDLSQLEQTDMPLLTPNSLFRSRSSVRRQRYACKQLVTLKGTTGKLRNPLPTLYFWIYALMDGNLKKFPC